MRVLKYYVENKALFETWRQAKQKLRIPLLWGIKVFVNDNKKKHNKKLFSIMSNLQTHYHFKLDFHKVDQHTDILTIEMTEFMYLI